MACKLEPVTLADRATLADIITKANFDDPYGQTVWPNSTIEERIAGSYARLPGTLLTEGAWLMKAVDDDGVVVAYAQWTLPKPLWVRLGGKEKLNVDEDMRARFERESAESCTPDGEPKGMQVEVVEACSPAMEAANRQFFPREEHIFLNQVKTIPVHQRRGAGSMLLQWGADLADREGLKICLQATPFGLGLYEKFGFKTLTEVHHDVSKYGGPKCYTHTLMMREPRAK